MALWRCPHCGTPQAETARCWVCRRSSTACGTCRHFRASVAAKVGYCGLDRRRGPLSGDEIRACWESGGDLPGDPYSTTPLPIFLRTSVPRRDFIEVQPGNASRSGRRTRRIVDTPLTKDPSAAPASPRWSLWEDAEG